MEITVVSVVLSVKDKSSLGLFIYRLTTLARWIGKGINK